MHDAPDFPDETKKALLMAVHEATGGDSRAHCSLDALAPVLGIDSGTARQIARRMIADGYMQWRGVGQVALAPFGLELAGS